jgi:hypothetical protein
LITESKLNTGQRYSWLVQFKPLLNRFSRIKCFGPCKQTPPWVQSRLPSEQTFLVLLLSGKHELSMLIIFWTSCLQFLLKETKNSVMDFSFVFSAPLPAWRYLFSVKRIFCREGTGQAKLGSSDQRKVPDRVSLFLKSEKIPALLYLGNGSEYRPFSYTTGALSLQNSAWGLT